MAYAVRTLAPPAGPASGAFTPGHSSAGPASRSSTPDRFAAVQASGFFRTGSSDGVATAGEVAPAGAGDAPELPVAARLQAQGPQGAHRSPHVGQGGQGQFEGQPGQVGRPVYEHFGHHRQPSPATQRDWRLPAREAAFAAAQAERAAGGQGEAVGRRNSGAGLPSTGPSPAPSVGGSEAAAPAAPAPMARYRGTVAQVWAAAAWCCLMLLA